VTVGKSTSRNFDVPLWHVDDLEAIAHGNTIYPTGFDGPGIPGTERSSDSLGSERCWIRTKRRLGYGLKQVTPLPKSMYIVHENFETQFDLPGKDEKVISRKMDGISFAYGEQWFADI